MTDVDKVALQVANRIVANSSGRTLQDIEHLRRYMSNSLGSKDAKRQYAWCEYGFPEEVSGEMLIGMYRRSPLAYAVVDKTVKRCWHDYPTIKSDSAEFQELAEELFDENFWSAFAEADRRRLAGFFSGLIIRYKESTQEGRPYEFRDPVSGEVQARTLGSLMAAWQSRLRPTDFFTDSQRMGEPSMWQYLLEGYEGASARYVEVHADRLFVLGDYSTDCVGFLEPAYNDLINLEKVIGGMGESFLKNASRQLAINYDPEIDLQDTADELEITVDELREKVDGFVRQINRGNDSALITQGASTTMLVAPIADPEKPHEVCVKNISAACNIPFRILVGSQSGERASTEDARDWDETCQSRRNGTLTQEIIQFVNRLIEHKVLPRAAFTVEWSDLSESSLSECLENAKRMAEINQHQANSAGQLVFSAEQIAETAGFELDNGEESEFGPQDEADSFGK